MASRHQGKMSGRCGEEEGRARGWPLIGMYFVTAWRTFSFQKTSDAWLDFFHVNSVLCHRFGKMCH